MKKVMSVGFLILCVHMIQASNLEVVANSELEEIRALYFPKNRFIGHSILVRIKEYHDACKDLVKRDAEIKSAQAEIEHSHECSLERAEKLFADCKRHTASVEVLNQRWQELQKTAIKKDIWESEKNTLERCVYYSHGLDLACRSTVLRAVIYKPNN